MGSNTNIDLMLEEYRALRSEILQSIAERFRILAFGMTAIGVLVAFGGGLFASVGGGNSAGLDTWEDIRPWILLLVVPTVCFLVYTSWTSEVHRGRRASKYLWGAERQINALAGQIVVHWEETIRLKKGKVGGLFFGHYYVTGLALGLIAVLSFYFGLKLLGVVPTYAVGISIVGIIIWIWIVINRHRYFQRFDEPEPDWPESLDPIAGEQWPNTSR